MIEGGFAKPISVHDELHALRVAENCQLKNFSQSEQGPLMVDSSYLFFLSLSFSRGATTKAKFSSQRKFQLVKMISALVNKFQPSIETFYDGNQFIFICFTLKRRSRNFISLDERFNVYVFVRKPSSKFEVYIFLISTRVALDIESTSSH